MEGGEEQEHVQGMTLSRLWGQAVGGGVLVTRGQAEEECSLEQVLRLPREQQEGSQEREMATVPVSLGILVAHEPGSEGPVPLRRRANGRRTELPVPVLAPCLRVWLPWRMRGRSGGNGGGKQLSGRRLPR